ncbi:MAG: hypothetical protein EXR79_01485 [Myxococcales bacterium]|nr:hypothetical protein [Myxococcales bacterium]
MHRSPVSRFAWALALSPSAVAALLLGVPGLGVLDYHASLVLAPTVGLAAGGLVLARVDGPSRGAAWGGAVLLLVGGPLAVLAAASLFIPNCNCLYGLGFYLLGPGFSALVGGGMAAGAALAVRGIAPERTPPRRVKTLQVLTFACMVAASLVPPVWTFLRAPQVFAYHGLVGYVAGALYEDAVAVRWPYVAWRLLDLALWGPIAWLGLAVAQTHPTGCGAPLRAALAAQPRSGLLAALALTAAIVAGLRAESERWRVPTAAVERALPVRVDLDAAGLPCAAVAAVVVLHLPRGRDLAAARAGLVDDVAFRWQQLRTWFGRAPDRMDVFVYADAASKRRWMGADRVDMAKPWLHQAHLVLPEWGASVLAHEMAHVFAASFASGPFGVPMRFGVVPDALRIEGLAVAAEWPMRADLDPHRWSRAMRVLGLAPPLAELWSPVGFLAQAPERAYTLAGSFLRWVYDVHGRQAALRMYAEPDRSPVAGLTLADLVRHWEIFVDDPARHPLTADDLDRAQARFERPGLFHRPCVLEVGRCTEAATVAWVAGNHREAAARWSDLVAALDRASDAPPDPDVALGWAASRVRIGDCGGGIARLDALLALPDATTGTVGPALNRLQRAGARIVRGDLAFQCGDTAAAARHWTLAATYPVGEATRRGLEVRRLLARHPAGARALREVFLAGGARMEPRAAVERLHAELPGDAVAAYLWARNQASERGPEAVDGGALAAHRAELAAIAPAIEREATRLLASVAVRTGDCARLESLILLPTRAAPQTWATEYRARCRFIAGRPRAPTAGDVRSTTSYQICGQSKSGR